MPGGFAAFLLVLFSGVLCAQDVPEHVITISGMVTDSVTGRGVAGALVVLQAGPSKAGMAALQAQIKLDGNASNPKSVPPPAARRAVTDENGKYSFILAEPIYASVQASHSGYVNGFNRTFGDLAQQINVKLVPTGVIEGRVLDSNGDPLPGISVEMIQVQIQDGRKLLRKPQTVRTNDLGDYRFWNIAPSSVYVKVAGYQGTYSAVARSSEAFPTVYFPAAPDRDSATLIRVPAGQTLRADFSMTARKSYAIRGVIRDAASYRNLGVRLMSAGDAVVNRVSINTISGAFQVYDVTPGSYTLQAYSNGVSLAMGEASVVVEEQDVTGVMVALSTGVNVQGWIEHLGGDQVDALQDKDDDAADFQNERRPALGSQVQALILQPERIPVTGTQPPADVDADGHFTFKEMLPGKYAFKLNTYDEYIESMRSGTTDVLADGLEVGSASPAELRVTLRHGGGSIQGVVTGLHTGEPGTVVLIRGAGLSGIPTIAEAVVNPNSGEAHFFAGNLSPGEYLLYAWPAGQEVEYRSPEAMRALSGNAVAVSLHERGEEAVTLKAISTEIQ